MMILIGSRISQVLLYRYYQATVMFQHSPHFGKEEDEDFEQVPSQFDPSHPSPLSYQNTPQFSTIKPMQRTRNPLNPKKLSSNSFVNKSQQFLNYKKEKIDSLKAEMEERVMADCTFKPLTNHSKSRSPRNIKQFLQSQNNFQARIDEKNNQLKQKIEEENLRLMTFSPKINKKKYNCNKENVHERLYRLKDKEKEIQVDIYDHIPKITEKGERMVRQAPVEELLYLDARRRAERQHTQKHQTQYHHRSKGGNVEKFAAQKFLKDYKAALLALNLQQTQELTEQNFNAILQSLGYSKYSSDQSSSLALEEHQLMKQAYKLLSNYTVTQTSLFIFLLAVGGIYEVEIGDHQGVDEDEGKKIHSYFDCLFRNRLFSDYSKKLGRIHTKQHSPFKPTINPDSENMAEKYRCKMIQRANSIFAKNSIDIQIPEKGVSHSDLLVICNLGQNLEKQKMRQQKLSEKDPECTFQPNSQKYSHYEANLDEIGVEKCQQLYEQAKAKQAELSKITAFVSEQTTKRKDLSPRGKPSKTSASQVKQKVKSYLDIKDVDKTLVRMALGRQIKNQKIQNQQRGQKITHKVQGRKHSQFASKPNDFTSKPSEFACKRELLFDADICINGKNKKIYIFEDDRFRIPKVVAKFCRECGLDKVSQKLLQEQLIQAAAQEQAYE